MRLEHWFYKLPLICRALFRRRQVEKELDDEIQYHLEMKTEQFISEGMAPEEARYAALRAMDGLELNKERCRDARAVRWLDELRQDTLYGIRMLRNSPGFMAAAISTLALCIGANTTIFTVVNAVLLRPLPYPEPGRLVCVKENSERIGLNPYAHAPEYVAWKQRSRTMDVAAYMTWSANLTGRGEATRIRCGKMTQSLLPA